MENKELTTGERDYPVVIDNSEFSGYLDSKQFEHGQRVAKMFASSQLVPVHYQNKQADCMIAFNLAMRLKIDPMLLMQKTYPIKGKLGIETQLAVALVNKAGVFVDVIQYEYSGEGDTRSCKAYATTKKGGKCTDTCSVQEAKDMGWWSQNRLWSKMTDTFLAYRSAMKLIRKYCPEVLMGLDTAEELRDTGIINVTPEHNGTDTQIISDKTNGKLAAEPFTETEKKKQTGGMLHNGASNPTIGAGPKVISELRDLYKANIPAVNKITDDDPMFLLQIKKALQNRNATDAAPLLKKLQAHINPGTLNPNVSQLQKAFDNPDYIEAFAKLSESGEFSREDIKTIISNNDDTLAIKALDSIRIG